MAGEGDLGPHETRRSVKSRGAPGAERNVHMERFFGSRRQVRDQLPLRSSRSAREDHDVTARKNERFGIKPGETSSSTDTEGELLYHLLMSILFCRTHFPISSV